jgi:hypothetical protein
MAVSSQDFSRRFFRKQGDIMTSKIEHRGWFSGRRCAVSGALLIALALTTPDGSAQTLYSFTGGTDGAYPPSGLAIGNNRVLYGTTPFGGISGACTYSVGCGAVFELKPPASANGAWKKSVIYAFPNGGDGYISEPLARPTFGPSGELYGTTYFGGTSGVGTVYELAAPSAPGGTWTETTLFSFSLASGEPQNPEAGVVVGKNGVLYGTVQYAGLSPNCTLFGEALYGCGAVYSLTPPASPGGAWTQQTLYTFQGGGDGAVPLSDLAIGRNGELYGTTYLGGPGICSPNMEDAASGCGTVYELDPPASPDGAWTETVLYSFSGGSDGGYPNSVVYEGGVLFGTVTFGGNPKNCGGIGCGGVFKLSPPAVAGNPWTERIVYSFTGPPDGLYAAAGVVVGQDGKLYGTTRSGGDSQTCPQNPGCGVVFELTPPQDEYGWREEVIHRFTITDGFYPTASLAIDKGGNLFGTTVYGGNSADCNGGCGVVFEVKP